MRTFSILALAASAFLPLISAAPVIDATVAVAEIIQAPGVDVSAKAATYVHARAVTSVATILSDLQANLEGTLCYLHHFTAQNATKDTITPVLKSVVSVVIDSVTDLTALKGQSAAAIMASVDGSATLSVSDIAQLLANVLSSIFLGLKVVLSVVSDSKILADSITSAALGGCLYNLIDTCSNLVAGLIAALVPDISSLASLIVSLGLSTVGTLLTII